MDQAVPSLNEAPEVYGGMTTMYSYKTPTNQQIADLRDPIIFGEPYNPQKYLGGCRRFEQLNLEQLTQLEALGALDMDDAQNESPTISEILAFLTSRDTEGWYAGGYCISPDRGDFRISIDAVGKSTPPSRDDLIDFVKMFRYADELSIDDGSLYCWFD